MRLPRPHRLVLGLAVAFNLWVLRSQLWAYPPTNDLLLHLTLIRRMIQAVGLGLDPTDVWLPENALGFPEPRFYQHLPHVAMAYLYHILLGLVAPERLLNLSIVLLLAAFPLAIYASARRLGFSRLEGALAGLASSLISTQGAFGPEYGSFVWRGHGLYGQLWATLLWPLALAQTYHTVRWGRRYWLAAGLVAATLLAHALLGYMLLLGLPLTALLAPRQAPRRLLRLAAVLAPAGLAASYFVLPVWAEGAVLSPAAWDPSWWYESIGMRAVLSRLATGQLFDHGRPPVLTVLVALGLIAAGWRSRRREGPRLIVLLFLLYLALYAGRVTWGSALDRLPLAQYLQLFRFHGGAQMAAFFLVGAALALPRRLRLGGPRLSGVQVAGLALLVLVPAFHERMGYLRTQEQWLEQHQAALTAEAESIEPLLQALGDGPPGRVYAGLPANWGAQYRIGFLTLYHFLFERGFEVIGLHGLRTFSPNGDLQPFFDEDRLDHYRLFNVRYILAPEGQPEPGFARPILSAGRHRLYEVDSGGAFELVEGLASVEVSRESWFPAARDWLLSNWVRRGEHLVWGAGDARRRWVAEEVTPERLLSVKGRGRHLGMVVEEPAGLGLYRARAFVERPALLLLKAGYHPGWQALVDGRPAPLLRVSPSYPAVALEPGEHEVRLTYAPSPWRSRLMLLGGLGLLATWAAERAPVPRVSLALRRAFS